MAVVLFLLALAMMATGATAVYFGAPIIQIERGWSMVISGSGVASAGALLLGIGVAAQRLRRVEREVRRLGDRITRAGIAVPTVASADAPDGSEEEMRQSLSEEETESRTRLPPPVAQDAGGFAGSAEPRGDSAVVGRYASGGNSYVMYADGSIHADTPTGHHRFGSLDELKSFVAAGGERGPTR